MKFNIQHFDSVISTNLKAKELAEQGAPEGLVITTDFQTGGYGKLGRVWISPEGKNLLMSLLIRPSISSQEAPMLTQIVCRSVANVLKTSYGIESQFKKPNDILVRGRKICGTLVESSAGASGRIQYAVIGIGLNVNSSPSETLETAISISEILGHPIELSEIRDLLLTQLKHDLEPAYASSI